MAVELKTETAIAVYMDAAHLVDELTCVVRSTSDLPTELSTAESSDQDSCVGYWTDSTSEQGDGPQQNAAETSPVSDWTDVGQRLSSVFQNFDSDEEDDAEDFAEPSSLPRHRLPPGLTLEILEPLDTLTNCDSGVATEDDEMPFALRLSETFRNFNPDEDADVESDIEYFAPYYLEQDADVESDIESVTPSYLEQDISFHDIPDFGPPPGLTRKVVALGDIDEAKLRILMTKDEIPAWRSLSLQLASAVADVKLDDPYM